MEDENQQVKLSYSALQFGVFNGHKGWVTKICTSQSDPDTLITTSRDKTILIWKMYSEAGEVFGKVKKMLTGHNHFISDCTISRDGGFVITSSWDRTMRLWDINRGVTKRIFTGHTNDVMSIAFSSDNRQIISGSRDNTVRLWNTLAAQKYVFEEEGHRDCVSSVLTRTVGNESFIISGGWDKVIKVWGLKPPGCITTFHGHQNAINSLSLSPDACHLASGGKDGTINVWRLEQKVLFAKYAAGECVNVVSFNPQYRILAAAVGVDINLYNLATNEMFQAVQCKNVDKVKVKPSCTSITWSNDGTFLFAGYTDGKVRAYYVRPETS